MPALDYHGVGQQIVDVLIADADLGAVRNITLEESQEFGPEQTPWVNVRAVGFELPEAWQPIAAGTVGWHRLTFAIDCWEYQLDDSERASQFRSDLVGKVLVALMRDRTLQNTVQQATVTGGTFTQVAEDPNVRLCTMTLVVDARATTT